MKVTALPQMGCNKIDSECLAAVYAFSYYNYKGQLTGNMIHVHKPFKSTKPIKWSALKEKIILITPKKVK